MNAIERLYRDHVILRTKLTLLETALQYGPEMWFTLREVCYTLAKQLQDHIQREEALIAACRAHLPAAVQQQIAIEHQDEPGHVRALVRAFLRGGTQGLRELVPALRGVIQGLRRHMEEEEQTLFPVLCRYAGSVSEASPAVGLGRVEETMTVNRIIRAYPQTRLLLERLFVNVMLEGTDCLDEVAWRHGMEADRLVQALEDAIGPSETCRCGG